MLLNSLHAAYLHIYIKHRTHQSESRDQRDTHRPNIIPLISTHTDTKTLSTCLHSLVALKPTERQSALSWSPIQTFMTSLNFQLCHWGLKSARFSLGLYGNALTHAHQPLNHNNRCLPGFLHRGRRIHQHFSVILALLSDQLGIIWKWVTVANGPLLQTRPPSEQRNTTSFPKPACLALTRSWHRQARRHTQMKSCFQEKRIERN